MNMKEDDTHKHNDTLDTSIILSLHVNGRQLTKQTSALDQMDTVVCDQVDTEWCDEIVVLLRNEVIQARHDSNKSFIKLCFKRSHVVSMIRQVVKHVIWRIWKLCEKSRFFFSLRSWLVRRRTNRNQIISPSVRKMLFLWKH